MSSEDQARRLENILGWLRTAKETLPAVNEGNLGAARVAAMSALVDRLHRAALRLEAQVTVPRAARRDQAA